MTKRGRPNKGPDEMSTIQLHIRVPTGLCNNMKHQAEEMGLSLNAYAKLILVTCARSGGLNVMWGGP